MSLSEAIKNKSIDELKKTVEEAVALYSADKPAEPAVEIVHGSVPISAIFDEDTKWSVITAAYVNILNEVSRIPAGLDTKLETAKLIATNAVLRNITENTSPAGGLL